MMKVSIFAAAIMAAVSHAAEESSEPVTTWDDMCFHCIHEGNVFCVDGEKDEDDKYVYNAKKGKCMEATCIAEDELTTAQKLSKSPCHLKKDVCGTDDESKM